jgi:hypothetical protein
MSRIRVVVTGLGATTPAGGRRFQHVGEPFGREVRGIQDRGGLGR